MLNHFIVVAAVNRKWRNNNNIAAEPFISLYVGFAQGLTFCLTCFVCRGDYPSGILYEHDFVFGVQLNVS